MATGEHGRRGERVVRRVEEDLNHELVSATVRLRPMEEQLVSEIRRSHNNATTSRAPLFVRKLFDNFLPLNSLICLSGFTTILSRIVHQR